MIVGLVQYNPVWENKTANKEQVTSLLLNSEAEKIDLLILPEMSFTGFSMKPEKLAEDINGDTFNYLGELAGKFNMNILAGIIEKEGEDYFNSLIHVSPLGALKAKYRKIHPFSFSTEDKHYKRGEKTVTTQVGNMKIGLTICYDLRFPELYRLYAKERVDLIVNTANWPVTRIEHWRALLKARAIENQCFIAGVNRVGSDPKLSYNGYSGMYDPMGREIVSVANEAGIITTDISRDKVEEVRQNLPFLNDIHLI